MMLSKALPIFLIATFSPVTEFTAALKFKNQEPMNIQKKEGFDNWSEEESKELTRQYRKRLYQWDE